MRWRVPWRNHRGDELDSELGSYLSHEIDRNMATGMTPREAAWAARRKIGNMTKIKETSREMNPFPSFEGVWQDIRYGARLLRTNPGFTAVAVISLALGIGANTAIFQLVDSVRLRPLPVPHAEQLAELQIAPNEHCCSGNFSDRHPNFTFAQWDQIHNRQQAFSSLLAWGDTQFNLANGGEVRMASGLWVSGGFFDTLEIQPHLGRLITPADDRAGCGSAGVVISDAFWHGHFGADPAVVGKKLSLSGHSFDVIGVTPAGFSGVDVGQTFDVAAPICAEPLVDGENSHISKRHHWWLAIMGRLKPGWTVERASAQLKAISRGVFENTVPPVYRPDQAKYYAGYQLTALPAGTGVSSLREDYNVSLLILLGIAGLLLLIACANLANLMLARASAREREMAIRLAIGASRARLIRQLLAESFLLASSGAVLGILLAQYLSRYLVWFLSSGENSMFLALDPSWRVLGFTAAVAILTCFLFGLTPAIRATRTAPAAAMKASNRGLTANRERFGLRRALVVTQVALSLVLLVGALLFVGSLRNLTTLDAGFRQNGLLITRLDWSPLKLSPERRYDLQEELLTRIRSLPGVEQAASVRIVQGTGAGWNEIIEIPEQPSHDRMIPWFDRVSGNYFRTMGTAMLAGRDFSDRDTPSSPAVAIVNQAFAKKFLGGASPLGKHVRVLVGPGEPPEFYEIVGLVQNSKYQSVRQDFVPVVFVAAHQEKEVPSQGSIILRSSSLVSAMNAVKGAVQGENRSISIEFQVLQTKIRDSLIRERLMATLSGFFGFLAAVLAAVGLYGVISYMVERRRNEIGIRVALGAGRRDVMGLVGKEIAVLLACGLVAGTAIAVAAARTASSLLYGLTPRDPWILGLSVLLMIIVALAASLVPTLRACRLEPMDALREE